VLESVRNRSDPRGTFPLRALAFALLAPLLIAACEGPVGPRGPQGPPGEGSVFSYIGILDEFGWGEVLLPPEVGDIDNPPLLNCYVADDDWYWYVINTDLVNEIYCLLEEEQGRLYAVLDAEHLAGWWFAFVVVY
jgi:hypothetical protein